MKKFKRRGTVISSHLSEYEVSLLTNLVDQLIGMVAEDQQLPAPDVDPFEALARDLEQKSDPPEDPVLARLFPTAYPDDDEAASDFRRFTESGLRDGKAAASGLLIDTLEDAGLPPELREEGLVIDVELTPSEA